MTRDAPTLPPAFAPGVRRSQSQIVGSASPGRPLLTPFRVHFKTGEPVDVTAISANEAREIALTRRTGIVTKVKIVREKDNG